MPLQGICPQRYIKSFIEIVLLSLCHLYLVARLNLSILGEVVYLKQFFVFYLVLSCNFFQRIALFYNVNAFR